jgi:ABC-type uncharacterized transport system substrate-binding protein
MQFDQLRRREFITLLGGAATAWPLAARAQQTERARHIGVLVSGGEDDPQMQSRLAGFRQGLARLGWLEHRNIQVDYRYASASAERAQALAKELIALGPEAILATAGFTATALHRETRVIPIVFVGVPDPIGAGLIATLSRPGGNFTGMLLNEASVVGKWLAMLKEMAPELMRVAVLFDPKTSPYPSFYSAAAETAARALAVELVPNAFENAADIERLITGFARTPNGGLLVPPDLTAVLPSRSHNWARSPTPSSSSLPGPFLGGGWWPDVLRDRYS